VFNCRDWLINIKPFMPSNLTQGEWSRYGVVGHD
jgi:hypothetical protein